ncbi:riboflavin synthase [Portibacter lacus]|uniref:Riboflavin synthase n=1 Tax=Portibacter lacus TaxID=1099794 RepID=A0AA37SX67_9BACT|nr:riboflavin synthase [Portibacter lacus]GLR19458.1 riboflavin synthase subunit alpha [Portibacter lacus]
MFTGIVEHLGEVIDVKEEGTNKHFTIKSGITHELQIDQSVSHNGVCLTVVSIKDENYVVTAIDETLQKTNLGSLKIGDKVNLERSLTLDKRIDGHMVQGHVDTTANCIKMEAQDGSWLYRFSLDEQFSELMVEKGSICVSGTSLTIFDVNKGEFSVAIIPYTYEHTIFHQLKEGSVVNIEFDMMGKYILKYLKKMNISG